MFDFSFRILLNFQSTDCSLQSHYRMKQPSMILILPCVLYAISTSYAQSCFSSFNNLGTCSQVVGQCRNDYTNTVNDLTTCQLQATSAANDIYCRCCAMINTKACCDTISGCSKGGFQGCYDNSWNVLYNRCINNPDNEDCAPWDTEGKCTGLKPLHLKQSRGLVYQH